MTIITTSFGFRTTKHEYGDSGENIYKCDKTSVFMHRSRSEGELNEREKKTEWNDCKCYRIELKCACSFLIMYHWIFTPHTKWTARSLENM